MRNADKPYKRNGFYTARWSEPLQMFVAEKTEPDGPMGWAPYDVVFEISEETYSQFDAPGFDPSKHLIRPLYCTKAEYNSTPESQAFYRKCKEYRRQHK